MESETSSSDNLGKLGKYQLSEHMKRSLVDLPDVLVFIEKLQKAIERFKKRLKKLNTKKKKTNDASTQFESQQSIAEEIAEAAEQAVLKTGMAYEESSGLYYDYKTGYYYNAEYGLYYDGNTGTYMTYNATTDSYEFYSKVELPEGALSRPALRETEKKQRRKKEQRPSGDEKNHVMKRARRKRRSSSSGGSPRGSGCSGSDTETVRVVSIRTRALVDREEGECSDNEGRDVTCTKVRRENHEDVDGRSNRSEGESLSDLSDCTEDVVDDITRQYPPCIRVIVEDCSIPTVRKGALYMVPYTGGTLGREGASHAILLPDINVSKHHLRFRYDETKKHYLLCDLGSRNGTLLNGARMAPSKQESDPMQLVHGSRIQIGTTVLLCHIHKGAQTCGHCEPGLIQTEETADAVSIGPTKSEQHKKELKKIRKRYGITGYELGKVDPGEGYSNRAQTRRETVGSSSSHEKTQAASLAEAIPVQNKGFKMLAKMGWTEGTSLGKDGTGRLEPVALVSNPGTSGMGRNKAAECTPNVSAIADGTKQIKQTSIRWLKTKERFDKLPEQLPKVIPQDDEEDS